jgi:hypothetical protein
MKPIMAAVAAALLSSLVACGPPRGGAYLSSSAVATPRLIDGCDPSETVMECDRRLASSRLPEAIDSCDPSETVMECDRRLASSRSPEDAVNAASCGVRGAILTCDAASAEVGTLTARRDVKLPMVYAIVGYPHLMRFKGISEASLDEQAHALSVRYWADVRAALSGACHGGDRMTVPTEMTKDYCDFSKAIVPSGANLSYCVKS